MNKINVYIFDEEEISIIGEALQSLHCRYCDSCKSNFTDAKEHITKIYDLGKKLNPDLLYEYSRDGEELLSAQRKLLNKPIEELDFTVRTSNVLKGCCLLTLGDLIKCSPALLMKQPNFGKTSLSEVKNVVAAYGLKLSEQADKQVEQKILDIFLDRYNLKYGDKGQTQTS